MGSFLCCQARRLKLKSDHKGKADKKKLGARSVCLSCGRQLKWYDNIPIVSWMLLRGKCRKCGKKIGLAEILSEVGMATAFLLMGIGASFYGLTIHTVPLFPWEWVIFVLTLVFTIGLGFLAIYDGLYGQLPVFVMVICGVLAVGMVVLRECAGFYGDSQLLGDMLDLLWSVLILGGLYLVLYLVSKGKWVGDGDWILGSIIALALGKPWLALVTLFVANLLACIVMAPIVRKRKNTKIYFGPFMVAAFVIVSSFVTFINSMLY